MKRKLALQLYTLRQMVAEKGMKTVLELVKSLGYSQVEPAGFGELTAAQFAQACKDNGLEICSSHTGCTLETIQQTIDTVSALGIKYVCLGYGPDAFKDMDAIKATADNSNAIIDKLAEAGLKTFQHNHYWEFELLEGRLKYQYYLDLCTRTELELDVFWSANFGKNDAVAMVRRFADRISFLHLKDGLFPANPDNHAEMQMCPLGNGQLDIPAIAAATPDRVQQIIVELDSSNVEIVESVRRSHDYLAAQGLIF